MYQHQMLRLLLSSSCRQVYRNTLDKSIGGCGGRPLTQLETIAKRQKSDTSRDQRDQEHAGPKKPDLRKAGVDNGGVKIIGAACLLVAIYMYPMIFKPLWGIGSSRDEEDTKDNLNELRDKLQSHRPSNMPEWTSPFGPRKGE